MFSNDDIRELVRQLPPVENFSSAETGSLGGVPPLLASVTEDDFVIRDYALQKFEHLVSQETHRISVSAVSRSIDVDQKVILKFVQASPKLALLSEDRTQIITRSQRDGLEADLREHMTSQIISKSLFSREFDVSLDSIDILLESLRIQKSAQDGIVEVDGHILSDAYRRTLEQEIRTRLIASSKNGIPFELTSAMLPGNPPMRFVSQILEDCLDNEGAVAQWHIEKSTNSISCASKESVMQKRDAEVARLKAGTIPSLNIDAFYEQFLVLYPTIHDARDFFKTIPEVRTCPNVAISETWLSKRSNQCLSVLETNGFVDVTAEVTEHLPQNTAIEVYSALEDQTVCSFGSNKNTHLHKLEQLLVTSGKYDSERDALLTAARSNATNQWKQVKKDPNQELKFQMADVFASIPPVDPVLGIISNEKAVRKAAEDQYWAKVSHLELENEVEFSVFWIDRVVSRIRSYAGGLNTIEDIKLRDQLGELLSTYVRKELIPESTTKARSQGLVCSRKTQKNLLRLEGVLRAAKLDVENLVVAIEKFGRKQGIRELDESSLAEAKRALINDMVRRMQKQSDGPLLFLTLVVVLLARHQTGVVCATGKFAPKLLKQLKSWLDAEQYEQLERWKDLAKAGALTTEDKESMKRIAADG